MLNKLRWLADHFDPQHTLVYMPGWEGRYYWQYGDYRPDPRMGGEEGFASLIQDGNDLGFHMMPMFGINVVNQGMENFEQWGAQTKALSADGYPVAASIGMAYVIMIMDGAHSSMLVLPHGKIVL